MSRKRKLLQNEIFLNITEDIKKLENASQLVQEVFENLNNLEKSEHLVIPATLHSANTSIRNIINVLKIVLDPDAKVSISIPMFTHKDKEDSYDNPKYEGKDL